MEKLIAKGIVLFLLLALALPIAHAEKYYVLTAQLMAQQVIVSGVKMENVPVAVPESDGDYVIEVASIQHEVLYTGRYDLQNTPTSLYIPYDAEGNYLTIKKSTGEVLQRVSVALFSSVCGDRLCQSGETVEDCREDCFTQGTPEVQEEESPASIKNDSKPAQVEIPASTQNKPIIKKPVKRNVGAVIVWAALLGVIATSGGFWIMLKKAKDERLGQIKQYLHKYSYYPQDQVKRALLMRGIKEEDIEEALRQN